MTFKKAHGYQLSTMANSLKIASNRDFHQKRNFQLKSTENTKDQIRKPKSSEWLDMCFLNRITRKVRNDATVSINNELYDVPMEFIRPKVEIRYEPNDMHTAFIFYDKKKYSIRPTNKNENCRTKRKNNIKTLDYSRLGVKS